MYTTYLINPCAEWSQWSVWIISLSHGVYHAAVDGIYVMACLWWHVCDGMFVMACSWWHVSDGMFGTITSRAVVCTCWHGDWSVAIGLESISRQPVLIIIMLTCRDSEPVYILCRHVGAVNQSIMPDCYINITCCNYDHSKLLLLCHQLVSCLHDIHMCLRLFN
jgi:hypothetical protein